jgi:hypothetical protein
MEGQAAIGEEINLETYGALTDRLGRTFQRLGLKRQPRDVGGVTFGELWRQDLEEQRQADAKAADTVMP